MPFDTVIFFMKESIRKILVIIDTFTDFLKGGVINVVFKGDNVASSKLYNFIILHSNDLIIIILKDILFWK